MDDRTRRAWLAVREKAPDRPDAYRGLAHLALLQNDRREARQQIVDGLAACGDRPELLALLVLLVTRFETDDSVRELADSLLQKAQAAKTDPAKWCLAAIVCEAADRRDFALAACRAARAVRPDHPWACATEARLWVRAGTPADFARARQALEPLGEAALRTNPGLAWLNARVMVGTGLWVLADDEFRAALDAGAKLKPKTAAAAVAFLRGVFDAPPDADRAGWVAARAAAVPAEDPAAPAARRLRADALYRLAELSAAPNPKGGAPVWDGDKVAAALRALDDLTPDERADPGAAAAAAALQLKGVGNAAAALRAAGPLRASEAVLTPGQLEVLGAVLTANDHPADAVRVLERAVALARPGAGCWVALALAYHKNNQPDHARSALARAEGTAGRSDREQAELVYAKQLLQREIP